MSIPIYNCIIEDSETDDTGIFAMSFVESPANETNFIALSDEKVFMSKDGVKHILTGVVLKPDQLIYRAGDDLGERYIKFSAEQIEKISQKMMRTGLALKTTTHQHLSELKGNYLIEIWIVEDPKNDKSNALGFVDLPKGTLMCSYKVTPEYWDRYVTAGDVKGFSLEGFFKQCRVDLSKNKNLNQNNIRNMNLKPKKLNRASRVALSVNGYSPKVIDQFGKFLQMLSDENNVDNIQSGESYRVFRLADGKEVFVDDEGYVTIDGEQMPAGDHVLADGQIMVVDQDGKLSEIKEAESDTKEAGVVETLKKLERRLFKLETISDEIDNKDDEIDRVTRELEEAKERVRNLEDELERVKDEKKDVEKENTELKKKYPTASPKSVETNMSNLNNLSNRFSDALTRVVKNQQINKLNK